MATSTAGMTRKWVTLLGAAVAGPFALSFTGWEPPSDYARTLAVVTCVAAVLVANDKRWDRHKRQGKKLAFGAVGCAAGLALVYSLAYEQFVIAIPRIDNGSQTVLRFWRGFTALPGVRDPGSVDTYAAYGYEPERIWTTGSLLLARAGVLGTYAIMFGLLTFGVARLLTSEPVEP